MSATNCGSGSGGRVAVYTQSELVDFTGKITAAGGAGGNLSATNQGTAGSVYIHDCMFIIFDLNCVVILLTVCSCYVYTPIQQ